MVDKKQQKIIENHNITNSKGQLNQDIQQELQVPIENNSSNIESAEFGFQKPGLTLEKHVSEPAQVSQPNMHSNSFGDIPDYGQEQPN